MLQKWQSIGRVGFSAVIAPDEKQGREELRRFVGTIHLDKFCGPPQMLPVTNETLASICSCEEGEVAIRERFRQPSSQKAKEYQ
jgi:hypothetical protein